MSEWRWGITKCVLLTGLACTPRSGNSEAPALSDKPPSKESSPPAAKPEPSAVPSRDEDGVAFEQARQRMGERAIVGAGIESQRVIEAMRTVPRHQFVLPDMRQQAYADRPLPIVGEQTISQPYIVAFMTAAADIQVGERCLEIGTGSGYQAAVLVELCAETYSIEYLPEVAAFGRSNLQKAGYLERNLQLRVGDGYAGWPQAAPFDAILVTAAPDAVPQPLLDQLAMGGKLVIPVGPRF